VEETTLFIYLIGNRRFRKATMKKKLYEALQLCHEMCADIDGAYPIELLRVRRLIRDALAEFEAMIGEWDMEDRVALAGEEPPSAA
jgi:hypothetical protein